MTGCVLALWVVCVAAQSSATHAELSAAPATDTTGPKFVFDGTIVDALEFFRPHRTGNGRSCATCHRPEDTFGLTPATVEARYQLWQSRRRHDPDADDPLFRSIDADDFAQDFTTLRTKALVRVALPLASNVKLADDPGATSVLVWRAVSTVINAGPYAAQCRCARPIHH